MMPALYSRRRVAGLLASVLAAPAMAQIAGETLFVAKSPTCGCCADWVDHMRAAGFDVEVTDVSQDALYNLKSRLGVGPDHASCHTARIAGYFVEGHVPAADIFRLLEEKPDIVGLTAPGMPQLSPGMHSETPKDYDVLSFDKQGRVRLPAELARLAAVQKEIVLVGVREHLEIWDRTRWEEYLSETQPHYDDLAENAFVARTTPDSMTARQEPRALSWDEEDPATQELCVAGSGPQARVWVSASRRSS